MGLYGSELHSVKKSLVVRGHPVVEWSQHQTGNLSVWGLNPAGHLQGTFDLGLQKKKK